MFKKLDRTLFSETLNMAWPAIVESFFVALAGIIDSAMVSSLGASAVAAVGLTMDRDKYRTSADCQYTVNGQRAYSNNFSYEENVGNSVWYTFPALPAAAVKRKRRKPMRSC